MMRWMRRCLVASALLQLAASGGDCSGSGSAPSPPAGQGGRGGATTGGARGSAGSGGASTGAGGTSNGAGGATTDAGLADSGFTTIGVCGQRGMATANATSFMGYEEFFILSDEGFGAPVCVVRFDLLRVGAAPGGCTDCTWSHLLEYSNPSTPTDEGGVCANSERALNAAAIAAISGTRLGLGFAREYLGAHGSARMIYSETTQMWGVAGNATWDETMNTFRYDFRDGFCNY